MFRVEPWGEKTTPSEQTLVKRLRQEGLSAYRWSNAPGDTYPPHTHGYQKVIYVVRGTITWVLGDTGEEVETRAGDRIELEPGTLHAARVGPEGVVCLEAHRKATT